ncbi:pre-mRNA processing factor 3-domain-containing protein [Phlyctochytrium arcticum]|nr:pre-mRNA processing factor 3-domain-containing protein [Phlyctochytrium arcticum]
MSSSRDSLKRRAGEDGGPGRDAKKTKNDTPTADVPFDAEKVKAEVAAKAREIQERMATMRRQGLLKTTASPSPAPLARPGIPTGLPKPDEVQRRIEEAKNRIRQSLQANPVLMPGGKDQKGLNMAYHPALMMDKSGQLNIKSAKSLTTKPDFATVKANQRLSSLQALANGENLKLEQELADFADPTKNPYYDPNLGGANVVNRRERVRKSFKFVQPGRFINQANQLRAQAQLEKLKKEIAESVRKTGMDAEIDLVAEQGMRKDPPPAVEWWDAGLVPDGYDSFRAYKVLNTEESIVTNYIQHPIPIQPPNEPADPKPKPLMLTKKERKKLRRQQRAEIQKEKQEKVRLGLLPPDEPKLKISNLMRVLGNEAVQDPTQMESIVRAQMAARQKKANDLNAANKLTDAERKAKKRNKLLADGVGQLVNVAVFRVGDLSLPQHKFKVDMNAQQLNLTGAGIIYPDFCVVVVEGGPKGINAYKKLMLKRIDWEAEPDPTTVEAADLEQRRRRQEMHGPNSCVLVWEGQVKERQFKMFRFKPLSTEMRVKEFLKGMKAVQYWDAAKNYVPGVV